MSVIDKLIKELSEMYPEDLNKKILMRLNTTEIFKARGIIELTRLLEKYPVLEEIFLDLESIDIISEFDLRINGLTPNTYDADKTLKDNYDYLKRTLFAFRYKFVPSISKSDYYSWVESKGFTQVEWDILNEIIIFNEDESSLLN